MKIILNGKITDISASDSAKGLIEKLGLKGPVAVQINEEIFPFHKLDEVSLKENDTVEIFTMLGGG